MLTGIFYRQTMLHYTKIQNIVQNMFVEKNISRNLKKKIKSMINVEYCYKNIKSVSIIPIKLVVCKSNSNIFYE